MSGTTDEAAGAARELRAGTGFSAQIALACRVVPESRASGTLVLLCDAASDRTSAEAAVFRLGMRASFKTLPTDELERRLEEIHGDAVGEKGEAIGNACAFNEEAAPYSTGLRQHYVESLVARALAEGASDIHVQPTAADLEIRFRVDGLLRTVERLPRPAAAPLVAQIKVLARLPLAEKRLPHDGRFSVEHGGRKTDLRVSILPSIHGEAAVLRIESDVAPTSLEELGMPPAILERLRTLLSRRGGLILVGGPTGSGKTTTLYAMMRRLNVPGNKLLSVEDPVERILPGVNQIPVENGGMGFGESIRAMLRHSPDAIMVGEIRDASTAAAACEAALTGHLVLASAHARDAVEVAMRVADLGVSRELLSCVLEAALTQRLVRVLCPECSRKAEVPAPLARALGMTGKANACRAAVGCPACAGTGYKGRRAIFACAEMREEIRRAIILGAGAATLRQLAAKLGMPTLADSARALVESGVTSPEEALVAIDAA